MPLLQGAHIFLTGKIYVHFQKIQCMISIRNIAHRFNSGQANEVSALNGIDLQIGLGEFIVLIGANGSGKSTLLNVLAGTVIPASGQVFMEGQEVTSWPDYKRSRWVARVFQNPMEGTAAELTILENFRLAALRTSRKGLKIGLNRTFSEKVKSAIADLNLGMENKVHQPMGSLSGGQRQALCLLMAVMADIKVLLLDEPTAALDPRSAETVLQIADRLIRQHRITTVMVTHQLREVTQYGSRILQMHEGKILRDIRKEEQASLAITDLYEWFA